VLRDTTSRGLCGLRRSGRDANAGEGGVRRPTRAEVGLCVFITAGPSSKLFTLGGIWEDMSYQHVLPPETGAARISPHSRQA
jgi:hypothetical protein